MEAAQFSVEILETRGGASEAAVAFIGGLGCVDGFFHRRKEALEAFVDAAFFAQSVERLFGFDDLLGGLGLDVHMGGFEADILADADEIAADRQVIDHLGIVARGQN